MQTIKKTILLAVALVFIAAVDCGATLGEADSALKQAEAAYRKSDFDAAVRCCTEAIRLRPDFAEAYFKRGITYAKKGDYSKAIADYAEAIRLKPDLAGAYYGRGAAYDKKGDHDKAIADYTEVIRLDPKCAAAYCSRGIAYSLKGDAIKRDADLARAHQLATEDTKFPQVLAPISAPVVYEGLMLILSSEDGVAAITFTAEIKHGVKYRYRCVPKRSIEESGEGEVFEVFDRYKRLPSDEESKTRRVNNRGELSIKAGPLHLTWSFAETGKGYIYYLPERTRVQIANAQDFEKIDLARFTVGGVATKGVGSRNGT